MRLHVDAKTKSIRKTLSVEYELKSSHRPLGCRALSNFACKLEMSPYSLIVWSTRNCITLVSKIFSGGYILLYCMHKLKPHPLNCFKSGALVSTVQARITAPGSWVGAPELFSNFSRLILKYVNDLRCILFSQLWAPTRCSTFGLSVAQILSI